MRAYHVHGGVSESMSPEWTPTADGLDASGYANDLVEDKPARYLGFQKVDGNDAEQCECAESELMDCVLTLAEQGYDAAIYDSQAERFVLACRADSKDWKWLASGETFAGFRG